jgi:hypothetical protein
VTDIPDLVATVARYGLPGSRDTLNEPLTKESWSNLLSRCHRERLVGHLCAMVVSGELAATEEQKREVTAWDLQVLAHRARLDRLLLDAVGVLLAAGIDHRVLKGPAMARTVYSRPEIRQYFDIDLLAPNERFDDAVQALCAAGFRRRSPPPRPGYDARFAKSVTLRSTGNLEVDLHRTLVTGPFGFLIDLPALWASAAHIEVDERMLNCFGPEENLLHACCSAAFGDVPPRWSVLRDVAQLLQCGRVDNSRFVETVLRHHVGIAASVALTTAAEGLALDPQHELIRWAASYEPSRSETRRMRVYRDRRNFSAQAIESLFAMRGLRNRIAFGYAAVAPSQEFLRAFDTTRIGWLRRGNRSLRGHHE